MRSVLFKSLILIALGLYSLSKLNFHPFVESKENINVNLVYKDQEYDFELKPYTKLKEVLSEIELDDEADINKINQNLYLKNNDKIIIPIKEDIVCISINTADKEGLMTLHGIGPKTADLIIEYRSTHGLFQSIEEIMEIKGIGEKTFEKMKDALCI